MPHLEEPMELHQTKSLTERMLRVLAIAIVTTLLFLLVLSIAVIAAVD